MRHQAPECDSETLQWYALKVRTGSEPLAATGLRRLGLDPFSPTIQQRRRYSDRVKTVARAAFPGYLFCRFGSSSKSRVLNSPAVRYVVGFGGQWAAVPENEIEGIQKMLELNPMPTDYLRIGQKVRVTSGPLTGVEGILLESRSGQRLVLSVHLLQRSLAVELPEGVVSTPLYDC